MFAGIWETLPHVLEMNTAIKREYNVGIRKTMSIEAYLRTMWTHIIASICVQVSLTTCSLTFILYLLMSSADNLSKQFRPRSGLTKCRARSGSKLFDTLMVFLKEFFEKIDFEKNQQMTNKQSNSSSRQSVK